MDALNASFDLLKSQLFQCPPPPFNAGATYHSLSFYDLLLAHTSIYFVKLIFIDRYTVTERL